MTDIPDAPDACPVHAVALSDPGTTVRIHDQQGRYLHTTSALLACEHTAPLRSHNVTRTYVRWSSHTTGVPGTR